MKVKGKFRSLTGTNQQGGLLSVRCAKPVGCRLKVRERKKTNIVEARTLKRGAKSGQL